MRSIKFILMIGMLISVGQIFALPDAISALYVFGDRYSDQGNYFPDVESKCMNERAPQTNKEIGRDPGKTWAEFIAEHYGVPSLPSKNFGGNFAKVESDCEAIKDQVKAYLKSSDNPVAADALHVVWGGFADFFGKIAKEENPKSPAQVLLDAVEVSFESVDLLVTHGAKHILIIGIPDVSLVPMVAMIGGKDSEDAHLLSEKWNILIERSARYYKKTHPSVHIYLWNPVSLAIRVKADPSRYGFPATIDDKFKGRVPNNETWWCALHGTNPLSPDNYLFYNAFVPTTAFHRVISDDILNNSKEI